MIILFMTVFVIVAVLWVRKTHLNALHNEVFWFICSWTLIIGVHFASGVEWGYSVSFSTGTYIALCLILFLGFYGLGIHSKVVIKQTSTIDGKKYRIIKGLGWAGSVCYIFEFIRLNGISIGRKISYQISFLGSLSTIFISILLVCGLYEFGKNFIENKKIKVSTILELIGYAVPSMVNSGRESLLFVMIGVISMLGYSINQRNITEGKNFFLSFRKIITIVTSLLIFGVIGYIFLYISIGRFDSNDINSFLVKQTVPKSLINEALKFGEYDFLYYNFVSYFGHQLPYLEYVVQHYNGPYLGGLYELNIISRRLPSVLGLDYRLVYKSVDSVFSGGWQTIIGSFIFDFTKYLTPFVCAIFGLVIGVIRKKFTITNKLTGATLISLICISMFTTIQLGPFYNIIFYGAFVWWYLIFGNFKRIRIR